MKYWILCSCLFLIWACDNDEIVNAADIPSCENCAFDCIIDNSYWVITNSCDSSSVCSFEIFQNAEVDTSLFNGLGEGNKTVFLMVYSNDGDPLIADDEFISYLALEIPNQTESFDLSDEELSLVNLSYKLSCFCAGVKFIEVKDGCIQGQKNADGSWRIMTDIIVSQDNSSDANLKLDALFN